LIGGHRVIPKLLVENGGDINAKDASGSTALRLATENMCESVMYELKSAGTQDE